MMRERDKLKVLEKEGTILVKFGQVLVIFNRNTHAEYENDSYEDEPKVTRISPSLRRKVNLRFNTYPRGRTS